MRIHILVNCAGGSIAADKAVTDVDLNVWDHTMNLDLRGTFLVCRHTIPHLRAAGGGSIVNFTSIVALKAAFVGTCTPLPKVESFPLPKLWPESTGATAFERTPLPRGHLERSDSRTHGRRRRGQLA